MHRGEIRAEAEDLVWDVRERPGWRTLAVWHPDEPRGPFLVTCRESVALASLTEDLVLRTLVHVAMRRGWNPRARRMAPFRLPDGNRLVALAQRAGDPFREITIDHRGSWHFGHVKLCLSKESDDATRGYLTAYKEMGEEPQKWCGDVSVPATLFDDVSRRLRELLFHVCPGYVSRTTWLDGSSTELSVEFAGGSSMRVLFLNMDTDCEPRTRAICAYVTGLVDRTARRVLLGEHIEEPIPGASSSDGLKPVSPGTVRIAEMDVSLADLAEEEIDVDELLDPP